jgi:cyanophycin synthetase
MKKHAGSFFVVKPSQGTSGSRGITTSISTLRECRAAAALASLYGEEIIIERQIPGESYRLLVLNGKMIHATRRRGARVVGDGESTVSQLIGRENEKRRKAAGRPEIACDHDLRFTLQAQGLAEASVIPKEQEVLVKSCDLRRAGKNELRTVFNEDVTGLVCADLRETAVRAAEALNSRFAGIDIITLDPMVPLKECGGVINEVNTTPGLHHHYNLINGNGSAPAVEVLRYLLSATPSKSGPRPG